MSVNMQVRSSDTPHKAGGLGHFKTGATALVVNELLELQRKYAEFQREFAESTAKQIGMETDIAIKVGEHIVAAAKAESNRIVCDAAGAGASAGIQALGAGASLGAFPADSVKIETAELNAEKASLLEAKFNERIGGDSITLMTDDGAVRTIPEADQERATCGSIDMKAIGESENSEGAVFVKKDGKWQLSQQEIDNIEAINPKTEEGEALLRSGAKHWATQRESHQRNASLLQNNRMRRLQGIDLGTRTLGDLSRATFSGIGSKYAKDRGEEDRDRTLAETAKQLADGGVQATRQKISESERQALDLSDVLKRMNQENTFRG